MKKKSIFVKNFISYCSIGIYPNEKDKKQKIKVSVNLDISTTNSKDVIGSTVSYEKIISVLREIKNYKHINLLETLANKISLKLKNLKNLKKIKIEIVKCNILSGSQEVGVVLEESFNK